MNIKRVSSLKLLIAASILVGFGSYVFAPPVIAKINTPPTRTGEPSTPNKRGKNPSDLPKCTHPAQQIACRP
jgi:hypothetical protein